MHWAVGMVVPIHKKGKTNDVNNYRGITLISSFAKLFTSILNTPLKNWSADVNNSTDAQFGFKANHSTIDAALISNRQATECKKEAILCFYRSKKSF